MKAFTFGIITAALRPKDLPGSMRSAEFRFRHKDSSWRILESIGKNLLENEIVEGLVVNSRDVTQRKRIESGFGQRAQLTAVVPWQVEG